MGIKEYRVKIEFTVTDDDVKEIKQSDIDELKKGFSDEFIDDCFKDVNIDIKEVEN